jgi:mono/diheme cytochrome c family protein
MIPARLAAIALACLLPPAARADDPVDFVRDVRPIFERHCLRCHGPEKRRSGLRLDLRAAAMKGGDSLGPDIVPGDAKGSPLIDLVTTEDEDQVMPPKGRLSAAEVETLTRWIDAGAAWPDGVDTATVEDRRDHWSFKPLAVPAGAHAIDDFIEAKLREHGLAMSPPADRASWLRRVTFDLTGVPPTPEELAAFEADARPDAFERVADRLLASPRHGERWAQAWLDVVRYADTHGFEVNTERPNAWPYRDWVIRALNADVPYDRFVTEQIAGDLAGEDAATGFLVTASVLLPGQIGADEPSKRLARQDALDEIVNNVGQTFLGLSLGCARCHDHKFDPITAKDYYAMQAFVAGVEYADRPLRSPEAEAARAEATRLRARLAEIDRALAGLVPPAGSGAIRPMVNARRNVDRFAPTPARKVRFTVRATNNLEPCLDELEVVTVDGENVAPASAGATVTTSGDTIVADRHEPKHLNDGRYGNSRSWMSGEDGRGWAVVTFANDHTIDRVIWGRDREGQYADRLAIDYTVEVADATGAWRTVADASDRRPYDPGAKPSEAPALDGLTADEAATARALTAERGPLQARLDRVARDQLVFAGSFRTPDPIRLLSRGDPEQPREEVAPAVPAVFGGRSLPADAPEADRRRALAAWVASPDNPLTARVIVNRVWQGHFGAGLVATPSDLGRSGIRPTHPELLDWLAAEFVRDGWSLKRLHRRIVLSRTYRQSSATNPRGLETDADVRWLWRYPSRRVEAEAIRDAMLAVGGGLDSRMYGRGFDLFDQRGGLSGFKPVESFRGDGLRRMIYAHKVRREPEAVFGAFDCPDAGQSTAVRRASTTPIQALNLFNSRFTLEQSAALAERVKREAGEDLGPQIDRAYRLALGRAPTAEEAREAQPVVAAHGLAVLARALFNSNEFLFLP